MNDWQLLQRAAGFAYRPDQRIFHFGALAIRVDGTAVLARNAPCKHRLPAGHAEARLMRKSGLSAAVYVSRVRKDGSLAPARPCQGCLLVLASHRVTRCIYSISDSEYGVIDPCDRRTY